ncbi:hypothetical protein N7452_002551 [Penicillium brevicompactum]|uniref:NAD(P)-binding protein n=1 Tax=Penicillium brevicompactum TaxID=5074 RepID=A0A9W9QXS4_PENBR|nr:hypothetical protein N7452_002551 [Penicillium brevicompactum]
MGARNSPAILLGLRTRQRHNPFSFQSNQSQICIFLRMPFPSLYDIYQGLRGVNPTTITNDDVPGTDLVGKWIIITGSNNGVGFESAKSFAAWGANLILACREPPTWERHPTAAVQEIKEVAQAHGHQSTIEWWSIDMADLQSVEAFAQRWLQSDRALDILCNNAGVAAPPPQHYWTKDGFQFVHQVNFLSHVLLTLHLLPSIARSAQPRIVCTTSCIHHIASLDLEHFDCGPGMIGEPYKNNKLWFQMWVAEMQSRFLKHPEYLHITINGVHPGFVASGIWSALEHHGILDWAHGLLLRYWAIDSKQGSFGITNAATNPVFGPNPETQGVGSVGGRGGGKYINRIWEAVPKAHCDDPKARAGVWKKLDEELHLQDKGLLAVLGL